MCLRVHCFLPRAASMKIVDTATIAINTHRQTANISMMYVRLVLALAPFLWYSRSYNFRLRSDSAAFVHLPYAGNACHITKGTQIELASILCGALDSVHRNMSTHKETHSLTHLHKIYSVCLQQDWCGFNGISSEREIRNALPEKKHTHTHRISQQQKNGPHKKATITN